MATRGCVTRYGNGIVDLEQCDEGACCGPRRDVRWRAISRAAVFAIVPRHAASKQCDDSSLERGCSPSCLLESCGDGITQSNEQCDDGNGIAGDGCAACTLEVCGDGVVQSGQGEQCDDGNTNPGDGCSGTCRVEACGDGIVQPTEQCDDGNLDNTDLCPNTCRVATCGDGFVRAGAEQCDDANAAANDGCGPTCQVETCGDGIRQTGPVVTAVDFAWLASSCIAPRNIVFKIRGVTALDTPGDTQTCTCSPGFQSVTVTDPRCSRSSSTG
jgi:cysteine-rich repeat protein